MSARGMVQSLINAGNAWCGTHSIYIGKYRDWETGSPIRNGIGNDVAVGIDGLGFVNGIGSEVRVVDLE